MENKEIEVEYIEQVIEEKICNFVNKYNKYPKYLKLPLFISFSMKSKMNQIRTFNIDYDKGMLLYKNLLICETMTIEKPEEIEVF
ncbi:MAG: hypothetical protein K1W33_07040 [Clostridia bacterium]